MAGFNCVGTVFAGTVFAVVVTVVAVVVVIIGVGAVNRLEMEVPSKNLTVLALLKSPCFSLVLKYSLFSKEPE